MDAPLAVVASPFERRLLIRCDERGICESRWLRAGPAPRASSVRRGSLLDEACRQTRAYFARRLRRFELPLVLEGTAFQVAVWSALAELETGRLVSYGELARAVGRPQSSRGVARAMAATPLALFVPAHRVVGADGRIKGAAAGSLRRRLLRFEGIAIR